jgi:acetyl esterase/lipase
MLRPDLDRTITSIRGFGENGESGQKIHVPLVKSGRTTTLELGTALPDFTVRALISFYPPTDFRITREAKRATNPKPEFNLGENLTQLFDESYLNPDHTTTKLDLADPYLSPAAAPDQLLRSAYPPLIILYTCEHDMLAAEGTAFGTRLKTPGIGKTVKGGLIKKVPHAFDKTPNPMKYPEVAERAYAEVCAELNAALLGARVARMEKSQLSVKKDVERFDEEDRRAQSELPEEARSVEEEEPSVTLPL